jgi:hypothetical protein
VEGVFMLAKLPGLIASHVKFGQLARKRLYHTRISPANAAFKIIDGCGEVRFANRENTMISKFIQSLQMVKIVTSRRSH